MTQRSPVVRGIFDGALGRLLIDLQTGGSMTQRGDCHKGERALGFVGGDQLTYFLDQCVIIPTSGCALFIGEPGLSAFAATSDDPGDVWICVDGKRIDECAILWISRASNPMSHRFYENRRVRHPAIHRGVCVARHRDAMLVLDRARLSIIPFAALRAL